MERGREVKGRVLAEARELAAAGEKERAAAKDAAKGAAKGAAKAGVRDVAESPVRDRDSAGEKNNKQQTVKIGFRQPEELAAKKGALRCQVEIERVRWEWGQ